MELITYKINEFAYRHPVIFWLASAFVWAVCVAIAVGVAIIAVLLAVVFFMLLTKDVASAFIVAFLIVVCIWVSFIFFEIATAISPGCI